jgi:hypothetical protein
MTVSGPTPTSGSVCTYVRCSGQCGLVLLGPSFSESDPKATYRSILVFMKGAAFARRGAVRIPSLVS